METHCNRRVHERINEQKYRDRLEDGHTVLADGHTVCCGKCRMANGKTNRRSNRLICAELHRQTKGSAGEETGGRARDVDRRKSHVLNKVEKWVMKPNV